MQQDCSLIPVGLGQAAAGLKGVFWSREGMACVCLLGLSPSSTTAAEECWAICFSEPQFLF